MDETSRCGERRALNARERSGDATSGDERRRDERRRDGEASPAAASPSARGLLAQRALGKIRVLAKGRSRAAGLPITSFCEARLLLELRVLAYGLSLTDRPIAVPPRLNCPTRCNHQNRPSWRSRDKLTSVT